MDLKSLQKKVLKCDQESYFVHDKMYADLSDDDILSHNCFHLVKAVGKIANYLEKKDHNLKIDADMEIVINQVIPDLIIYAVQFSNRFNLDLEVLLDTRIEQTVKKYSSSELP